MPRIHVTLNEVLKKTDKSQIELSELTGIIGPPLSESCIAINESL